MEAALQRVEAQGFAVCGEDGAWWSSWGLGEV